MRRGMSTEIYIEVTGQDEQAGGGVRFGLQGTTAPGGDSGDEDAAGIGSLYSRTDTGAIYRKKANAGSAADWEELGTANLSNLVWRQERVIAATDDSVSPGSAIDISAWTDNESGIDGDDLVIGDHVLVDCDGTPVLLEMTSKVSATSITLALASVAIADNNTFVVQNYLPDIGAAQEKQAIIHFPTSSSPCVKLSDFNWNLADGITLNGYSDTIGAVSGTETVQVAIQKIEKGLKDVISLTGEARNSVNFTAFSSPASLLINGTTATIKSAFQRIFDLYAQLRGVQVTGVTTETTIDEVPVASVKCVKWLVEYFETATPTNRGAFELFAMNDGTLVDYANPYAKLKLGSNISGKSTNVDISGGNMRLRMSFTPSCTVTARRIEVVKNLL